jgi:Cu+-exporting ATPase
MTYMQSFKITGMTCASCASRIERIVSKIEGINAANVNMATEILSVNYDQNIVSAANIMQAIQKIGFGADKLDSVSKDDTEKQRLHAQKKSALFLIASLILTTPLLLAMGLHLFEINIPALYFLQNPYFQLSIATPVSYTHLTLPTTYC